MKKQLTLDSEVEIKKNNVKIKKPNA